MTPEILATISHAGCLMEAVVGDMTTETVDAVVNAANSHLAHGGGLAGALVARGGQEIQDESDLLAPVPVGRAVVTSAGALPCRWVIHAVGPRWGDGDEERLLRSAVRSSLEQAEGLAAASIAIPAISTGIFGYPKAGGTAVIVDAALQWLTRRGTTCLEQIRFTSSDRETAELFARALNAAESPAKPV